MDWNSFHFQLVFDKLICFYFSLKPFDFLNEAHLKTKNNQSWAQFKNIALPVGVLYILTLHYAVDLQSFSKNLYKNLKNWQVFVAIETKHKQLALSGSISAYEEEHRRAQSSCSFKGGAVNCIHLHLKPQVWIIKIQTTVLYITWWNGLKSKYSQTELSKVCTSRNVL